MSRKSYFLSKSEQALELAYQLQDRTARDSLLQVSDSWRYLADTEGLTPGAHWPAFPTRAKPSPTRTKG